MREALAKLMAKEDLSSEEMRRCMQKMMAGEATPAQIGSFLTAMRLKGETVAEIAACAQVMREMAAPMPAIDGPLVDTCGTGGDGRNTFNISTAAAFVVAGAGLPVAKHGNRAASSKCGSADVLEGLGVRIDSEPAEVVGAIRQVGIGFLFARVFHSAMRHAAGPRQEIGFRTLFNLMGPLTNPAGAKAQVVGVYDPALTPLVAEVLGLLGVEGAVVVHGMDGLDEISISAPTRVSVLRDGRVETREIAPEDFGMQRAPLEAISGGDVDENARHIRAVLRGEPGPRRDVVVLNAAAALFSAGTVEDMREGVAVAEAAIDDGRAAEKLDALIAYAKRSA